MRGKRRSQPVDEVALKHAWDWFSLQANQRIQSVNLQMGSVALALTAYGVAIQSKNYAVAIVICIAGALIAVFFAGLDVRNRQLIRAGEAALRSLQDQLAERTGIDAMRFLREADGARLRMLRYTHIVRALTAVAVLLFIAGAIVAGVYAAHQGGGPHMSTGKP